MAPEIFTHKKYSIKSDVYAYAVNKNLSLVNIVLDSFVGNNLQGNSLQRIKFSFGNYEESNSRRVQT